MGGSGPFGEGSGPGFADPIAVENFHMLQQRQTADTVADPSTRKARVNLLNWDGKGTPPVMFPPRDDDPAQGPGLREPESTGAEVVQPLPAGGSVPGPAGAGTQPRPVDGAGPTGGPS
jgi:nitrate reductase beta subunit